MVERAVTAGPRFSSQTQLETVAGVALLPLWMGSSQLPKAMSSVGCTVRSVVARRTHGA